MHGRALRLHADDLDLDVHVRIVQITYITYGQGPRTYRPAKNRHLNACRATERSEANIGNRQSGAKQQSPGSSIATDRLTSLYRQAAFIPAEHFAILIHSTIVRIVTELTQL